MSIFEDENVLFRVVINEEQQFSVWPAEWKLPTGWHDEGTVGKRAECLERIDKEWTDMRPASLRSKMDQGE